MARRKQTDELTIERVIQWAAILSPGQRRELIDGLLALDELSEERSDRTPNPNDGNGGGTGRGSIERKTINGCGPYLYLRYWSGGKHRSVYLGKAESD
ncbi:hypothetical protein [Planktothrix tepida]|uniref:hypothetical protein n=1 Tax=Planktothrix tepida TaxID=1678309 RepID=UPI0009352612|nr:hypothetical protein [Planktothrix tepida]